MACLTVKRLLLVASSRLRRGCTSLERSLDGPAAGTASLPMAAPSGAMSVETEGIGSMCDGDCSWVGRLVGR